MLLRGRLIEHQLERINTYRVHKYKHLEYFLLSSHSLPETLHSIFQASWRIIVRPCLNIYKLIWQGGMNGLRGLSYQQMT